ncbi:hypothetical protein KIN20_029235 [Parelaphostrongylus tenuis]|uniref:Uncharacterized protein n=1 Tax=Parelaphostrongylus tenuis TaxID=148309 RepID=A0AAD5R206_PARTN|nr:hypothetical protein KIN20_029235 [Parelaphostrongylus tenuis]
MDGKALLELKPDRLRRSLGSKGSEQKNSNDNSNADARPAQNKKTLLQYRGKRPDGAWCTDESNISSSHPGAIGHSDWTISHLHSNYEHVNFHVDRGVHLEQEYSIHNSNANARPRQNKKVLLQYRGKRPDGTWCTDTDRSNISSSRPEANEVVSVLKLIMPCSRWIIAFTWK